MKKIRYAFEATFLHLMFLIFKCMPAKTASNFGGWVGRTIGPKLAASRKARKHISMAMPNISEERTHEIVCGMWENLGRVIAEYPHLETISKKYTTFENEEHLLSFIKKDNEPLIFIGGHLSNWEINSIALLTHHDKYVDATYRPPNNPWVAKLLDRSRTLRNRLKAYPKSSESGRKIMQALKDGRALGILIDQKYNEGIDVPFFNMPAMTNPIAILLSQRYRCPLIPVKNIRGKDGCSFRIITYPPLELFYSDGNPRPVEEILKEAHTLLEGWIIEHPEQWLWLHHRWNM